MEEASKVVIFIFIIVLSYSPYVLHLWSAGKLLLIVIEILETWGTAFRNMVSFV